MTAYTLRPSTRIKTVGVDIGVALGPHLETLGINGNQPDRARTALFHRL